MRVRDLSDDALRAERLELLRARFCGRWQSVAMGRRERALTREMERRWPRATAADFRRLRRAARKLEADDA